MPAPQKKSLLEVQFPIGQLSLESYIERKAGASQFLNSLGKWGRSLSDHFLKLQMIQTAGPTIWKSFSS
jgi:hypothetical protein